MKQSQIKIYWDKTEKSLRKKEKEQGIEGKRSQPKGIKDVWSRFA